MLKKICCFLGSVCLLTANIIAQKVNVATYNIRYDNPNDGENVWQSRAPYVAALVQFHDFDVWGTQEGLYHQLVDLQKLLPSFSYYGIGRDDGKIAGEHSAIFYKKEQFTLLDSGDFWLSETPDKPSKGWDAVCCKRLCSWVYLQHRQSGKKCYFFNVHFDHEGTLAQENSAILVMEKIKKIAKNAPVVLMGDFNVSASSKPYKLIASSPFLHDSYRDVALPYVNNTSFNGFEKFPKGNDIIDHIFLSPSMRATRWGLLTDTYYGKYPSDHFPVMIEVQL